MFHKTRKIIGRRITDPATQYDDGKDAVGAQRVEALKHSRSYSGLLNAYIGSTKSNIIIKDILKVLFFLITMGAFVIVVYCFYLSLDYVRTSFSSLKNLNDATSEAVLGMVTVILPSVCSLIVAFIKIPETIAKYLFNTDEDRYMDSMIKNIQDYDKSEFTLENKVKDVLDHNKDQTTDSKDKEMKKTSAENQKISHKQETEKTPLANQGDSAKEQDA